MHVPPKLIQDSIHHRGNRRSKTSPHVCGFSGSPSAGVRSAPPPRRPRDEKQGTVDADTRLRIDIHLRNTAVAPHPLLAVALTAVRNEHSPLLAPPPPLPHLVAPNALPPPPGSAPGCRRWPSPRPSPSRAPCSPAAAASAARRPRRFDRGHPSNAPIPPPFRLFRVVFPSHAQGGFHRARALSPDGAPAESRAGGPDERS